MFENPEGTVLPPAADAHEYSAGAIFYGDLFANATRFGGIP